MDVPVEILPPFVAAASAFSTRTALDFSKYAFLRRELASASPHYGDFFAFDKVAECFVPDVRFRGIRLVMRAAVMLRGAAGMRASFAGPSAKGASPVT